MSFKALLERFETLQKSQSTDDGSAEKIAAAASASGDDPNGSGNGTGESSDAGGGADAGGDASGAGGDEGGEGEVMGKSFQIRLDDGTVIDAEDGTALVKSLTEQVGALKSQVTEHVEDREVLMKSLTTLGDLAESQGQLIKSLSAKVDALGSQGRGRASVVNVAERTRATERTTQPNEPSGVKPEEFMAKAMSAFEGGRITGRDVAIAEGALAVGRPVPTDIVSKVLA